MNVKELIDELQKYKDNEVEVYIFEDGDIKEIELVDLSIDDRVDINVKEVDK